MSRSKLWYTLVDFYGRLIPVIVFIAAPLISIIVFGIVTQNEAYDLDRDLNDFDEKTKFPLFLLIVVYSALELGYGIEPIRFTNEKHFRKRGYDRVSVEFRTIKIVFVALFSSMLFLTFVLYALEILELLGFYGYFILSVTLYATVGAGFRILTQFRHKEFRYYLAKGYCITATKKEDDFEKANYLSATLDSYNKYLRRRSQIEIKDVKRIYVTFLAAEMKEKNQIIEKVRESLERDRLGLARYLSGVYKVPESEFFVEESIIQKMKPAGTFLAAAIPIIVSIIRLGDLLG